MAYTLSVDLNLGAGNAGLTLTPALFDAANVAAAGLTTTTMVEVAASSGSYLWTGTVPDGHRGYISFSSGATFKTKVVLNPSEVENPDVKTSTRTAGSIPSAATVAGAVWDEPRSSHLQLGTFGIADQVVRDGQAQAGSSTTLTLDAGASAVDNFYRNDVIFLKVGTGAGQVNIIDSYVGATRVATMLTPWVVTPDATSCFVIIPLALIPGASNLSAAQIWAYSPRTLTQTVQQIVAALSGSTITIHRGDTVSASLTGLGSLAGRSKLWFTVKARDSDADTAAIVQIEETAGLLYLNGAAATAGQGSLTVTDATTGAVTIALVPAAAAALVADQNYRYDVQKLTGTTVNTLAQGVFTVQTDITRATS